MQSVAGFDWDKGNREKCRKHGVSVEEIEAVFRDGPDVMPDLAHSGAETRFLAIGKTNGRHVFVAFTLRKMDGETLIRPVSARYMHKKEIDHYEEATRSDQ